MPNHPWGSELGTPRAAQTQQDEAEHPPTTVPPGHHTQQLGTERGAHTNPILGLGLRAQLCPAGDGPTCQKTQLRKATPTPCTVRKTHLSPAGLTSAPLLTPDLVLHQHTPQHNSTHLASLQVCVTTGQQPERAWNPWSSSRARHGPPRSWLSHPTPSHSPRREAQGGEGGGALHPATASITGESSWVTESRKVINRSERKISKMLWRKNDSWRGREAGFNMGLIENKIELI